MTPDQLDEWMQLAVEQAEEAADDGEVPVGAVVVIDGEIVGRGRNRTEALDDPSAHAEIVALRQAGQATGDWRLEDATLVVTLEPCPMCIGAIIQARVSRLVYGATDPRYGACGSAMPLPPLELTPHLREIRHATHAEQGGRLLRDFFRRLRARN
jgi:tRNA(adenine34) deaminase